MDWINTTPNMYVDGETYIACKHDFSDLEEKVDYVLSDYKNIQEHIISNFRKKLTEIYNPVHLVKHMYEVFKNLKGVVV